MPNKIPTQAGFTLLEMLVVLAIMALAAAILAPSLTLTGRAPVPPVVEYLQQQQNRAIQTRRAVHIYQKDGALNAVPDGQNFALPDGAELILSRPEKTGYLNQDYITSFYPDGTAVAADFRMRRKLPNQPAQILWQIIINPFHGGIEWQTP